jgi:uncharacterized membrane protein YccC
VLVAGYAPRAISFAAGQAAFTVTLFVLFNIIEPVGWKVGVVRVEDVAIGFAISLGVGVLFWPRGAGALLRRDLAAAYARSADYVAATARALAEGGDFAAAARAERAAAAAAERLEEAFRQYLAERSATKFDVEDVAALVGGAARVRRAGHSLEVLTRLAGFDAALHHCGANLEREIEALREWYAAFGDALVDDRPAPPPHARDGAGRDRLLDCVRRAAGSPDGAAAHAALALLGASQHLDGLWRLEAHLGKRARLAHADAAETGRLRRLRTLAS